MASDAQDRTPGENSPMPGEGVWRCATCGEWDDAGHDGALCGVCENGRLAWSSVDAALAVDPAIAASLAEWELTSGPLLGEFSPAAWLGDAMLALAQSNVPTDIQALLLEGDGRGGVAPGAMAKAIRAAVKVALSDAAYAVLLVHNARIARGNAGFTSQAMAECRDAIRDLADG